MKSPICEICKKDSVSYVVDYKLRNETKPREIKICAKCFEEFQKDKNYLYRMIEKDAKKKK